MVGAAASRRVTERAVGGGVGDRGGAGAGGVGALGWPWRWAARHEHSVTLTAASVRCQPGHAAYWKALGGMVPFRQPELELR